MILETFTVGPFAENCYLIGAPPAVAVVDPGAESERLFRRIDAAGWRPEAILLTHGHLDHIAHAAHVAERYRIGLRIHEADVPYLRPPELPEYGAMMGYRPPPEPEGFLEDGQELAVAGLTLKVLHCPGHTPGHVVLIHQASRSILVGDVIFQRGVGRTDLPGGDTATLAHSIQQRLFRLPGDYTLYPGHGPPTTLDEEREENPFFGRRASVRLR
ncbi:MAG TPA: MBL fold metallo-hydrolase [Thermoanaerobaculia bacterium]|nr:MBL fold metallo-hydrolase [Thermoanaerobaculia bacterium]